MAGKLSSSDSSCVMSRESTTSFWGLSSHVWRRFDGIMGGSNNKMEVEFIK